MKTFWPVRWQASPVPDLTPGWPTGLLAGVCLLLGGMIYLLDGQIQHFESLPLMHLLAIEPMAGAGRLPAWMTDHLADAVWAASIVLLVLNLYRREIARHPVYGFAAALCLALSWEVAQFLGVAPGTPDPLDLLVSFTAAAAAFAWLFCRERFR